MNGRAEARVPYANHPKPCRRWLARALLALLVVLVLAGAGFVGWASLSAQPQAEALTALQSDGQVQVTSQPWLVFRPVAPANTGLIFYPGGRVDPRAYAPAAHALARQGFLVAIVPMPLNLAVLGADRATDVIAAYPAIRHWAVGGHSLGGAMAAQFVYRHPDVAQGLVLWAAYPASGDDLSQRDLAVVSISGSRDGLATPAKIAASRSILPPSTRWVVIDGGNHGQFGWYGPQDGDNAATIDHQTQQHETVAATAALLRELGR